MNNLENWASDGEIKNLFLEWRQFLIITLDSNNIDLYRKY
jgi:hypothetical protein